MNSNEILYTCYSQALNYEHNFHSALKSGYQLCVCALLAKLGKYIFFKFLCKSDQEKKYENKPH